MKTISAISQFTSKYFVVWVILLAVIAYFLPSGFAWIAPYISLLLGIVMFGMGLTLKASDFAIVFRKPLPVIIGVLAQYIIMPGVAYLLAVILHLSPELSAGLVLVGACPGGTASNVMVYLAKGDVPLSVAMTSVSTVLAPILTPLVLLVLAGQWIPVNATSMFLSIVEVIIIPIIVGLLINVFFPRTVEKSTEALPLVSVVAIVAIVAAVVAGSQETIATSGLILFAAVILHNLFGLFLGYLAGIATGLNETRRRAISIEVGMQNSGLGASLATTYFNPATALPSAIFSVWHNISGPLLATIWSQRPVKDASTVSDDQQKSGSSSV